MVLAGGRDGGQRRGPTIRAERGEQEAAQPVPLCPLCRVGRDALHTQHRAAQRQRCLVGSEGAPAPVPSLQSSEDRTISLSLSREDPAQ